MRISWNWLSEYVDLDGLTPQQVGDALTMAGLELDGIEQLGTGLDPVVVAEILSIAPHPEADRLVVCQVRWADEPAQIVCGASNMKAGDRVPVIPAGNSLPDGTKIKRGKIRGQLSNGMMCSPTELGVSGDHDGLMILSADAPVGQPISAHLGLRDTVLELSITPNRGDALSYLGVAREIAAIYGRERRYPGALGGADPVSGGTGQAAEQLIDVIIDDPDGCPRYAAGAVLGVAVGATPAWMAQRLEAVGQRSVNNLVDVSNYVMLETGQPLHIFDFDKLTPGAAKRTIQVRRAAPGETITSIDHVDRALTPDDLVITDGSVPVAVAGVMGGAESEVSEATRNVLIECAHFDPRSVRKTSKRLGLHSESSHRFERSVDPALPEMTMRRTIELILATLPEGTAAQVAAGMVDEYPKPPQERVIGLRTARCNALLGTALGRDEMAEILRRIDLPVAEAEGDLNVTVPSFRPDLEREVDVIEEVGRLYGLDNLEATVPRGAMGYIHRASPDAGGRQPVVPQDTLLKTERVRDCLADCGLSEAVNYSFVARATIDALEFDAEDLRSAPAPLANPLSENWAVMRTSLMSGLLTNVRHNLSHQSRTVALFELGPVFLQDSEAGEATGIRQGRNVAVALAGERPTQWGSDEATFGALDTKRVLEALAGELGLELAVRNHGGTVSYLHPGVGAIVSLRGSDIGCFGQMHPRIATRFEIEVPVYVLEVSFDAMLAAWSSGFAFAEIARFPVALRDLALVLDRRQAFADVTDALGGFKNNLLESVSLASVYSGDPIPEGKKSVALSVVYRSKGGSLTDKKVDSVHKRLTDHLMNSLGAELR